MARTAVRRAKKHEAMQRTGELIPGVPSFSHGGGAATIPGGQGVDLGNLLGLDTPGLQASSFTLAGPEGGGGFGDIFAAMAEAGFFPDPNNPGVFINPATGKRIDLRPPEAPTGGGGAVGPRGPTQAELALTSRGLDIESQLGNRGLDLTRRSQDIQQRQFELQFELDQEIQRRNAAVAEGRLDLARQSEARIDRIQTQQNQLQRARLDLDVGTGLGNIASAQGNIELQRQQELARLAANPRDFAQLNLSLGGGTSFLGQALAGQQIGGQNTANVGGQRVLGGLFEQTLQRLSARPEEALFQEAAGRIRNTQIPTFQGGGKLVIDEPTVAIGLITGQPKFTLGEGGQAEEVKITPKGKRGTPSARGGTPSFQEGGEVFSSPFLNDLLGGTFFPGGVNVGLNQAVGSFGSGTSAADIAKARTDTPAVFFPQGPQDLLTEAQASFGQPGFGGAQIAQRAADVQASGLTRGQVIQKLQKALNPRSFFGLLPSQRDVLDSIVSLLGFEPEDFNESVLRGFPQGPNPASVAFGSNF